ncbi:hypothetical protein [Natronorubrum texcoconense]|uniref:Uncharacterized protein n=1 Tax=Natronorubrum texcoconense TaxID=1095776 RepID=A0A1G9A7J6_9EURY|nr:hypothetical protein [Natronorubrum texcoconense]SDK22784.1 hypothetical protein SAMN04515672_2594 [Natronorubrum texcoconense]
MDRRRFVTGVATAATAALAGCAFGDEAELSAELEDDDGESFEAEEGDELEVTVTVEEEDAVEVWISYDLDETVENADDDEDGATAYSGPVLDETVEDEETFDVEIPTDGYYEVTVTGGSARVTVE